MEEYHSVETLYNTVLTQISTSTFIWSLPIKLRISFNNKYTVFINQDADNNVRSPAVFKFLNQYMENLNMATK